MTQLDSMERAEVARALAISEEHVAVLLHRARGNLQRRLAKYLPRIEKRP